jgi:flagellar motor switch protein FliM
LRKRADEVCVLPDGDATARAKRGEPRLFDFRRPSKLNRDHVRTLEIVQETFARQFNTVLSSMLRTVSSVTVESIDQLSYDEYVRATPNPAHLSILSIAPLPGVAILQLPLPISLTAVDLMLGGHGKGNEGGRPLTDIEVALMRPLVDRILSELSYAFDSVVSFHPAVVQTESNPQFAQVAAPSDMIVVITLDVRIEGAAGKATLSFPYASLTPVLDSFTGNIVVAERDPAVVAQSVDSLKHRLQEAPVDVAVRFAPLRLTSGEIVGLEIGDVLPMAVGTDAELTVTVGDVPCFLARPARRGKRLACQITATKSEVPC